MTFPSTSITVLLPSKNGDLQASKNVFSCPAIDQLIESSKILDNGKPAEAYSDFRWISSCEFTDMDLIETSIDRTVYYAKLDGMTIMLLLLGNIDKCTPEFVRKFARTYSLPAHVYRSSSSNFRRYFKWLKRRNKWIEGFTKVEDNYYLVAQKTFYDCYSLYGFCSACGILRCSPVWCICGHKELANGWTSNNEKLDELIKKSQSQTKSANEAYLEWIPTDQFTCSKKYSGKLHGIHTYECVEKLIPLELLNKTDDQHYHKISARNPDLLDPNSWITIGFTYRPRRQTYLLIKTKHKHGLCLSCAEELSSDTNVFCIKCKAPTPPDWTTGNKCLDSFIMKSWNNAVHRTDSYIQWIEYSRLANIEESSPLRHKCTHTADWLEQTSSTDESKSTKVLLKKIVSGQDAQSFDFYKLTKDYPNILSGSNIWIIGITQEPYTQDYYLLFYYDIQTFLDKFIQTSKLKFMQFDEFSEIEKIGAGGYGTVYTARHVSKGRVVLKDFKNLDQEPELFIYELKNHARCNNSAFLDIYGVTQRPETGDHVIIMQYARGGSLSSYLDQNINKLTWKTKLNYLRDIAQHLSTLHENDLIHCDLHGGNIVLTPKRSRDGTYYNIAFICDLGLSRSANAHNPSTVRGVLPYIAPEVFYTNEFTQKSDIYAFGILMYLIASGELPFRDRTFDQHLVRDISNGLRPAMPDSTPEPYRQLAEKCCDTHPDKRPDANQVRQYIGKLIHEESQDNSGNNVWNAIYKNEHLKPLSRVEKESKYSSKLLPTRSLLIDSVTGSKRDDFLVTDELATPRDSKQVDLILPDDDAFLQEGVTR